MMTTRSFALPASLFFLLATGAAGCAPKVLGACDAHSDCEGGKACIDNACVDLCQVQSDCPANAVCGVDGHCVAPQDGPAPEIADVRGNDTTSDNSSAIANGLLVTGSNLATARFELRGDDGSEPLAVAYRYDTSAELHLPEDIRSGTYTLVATNLAGSDQEGVTLQLPELTGNMIVERLNTDATEKLTLNALPVGTGSGELALGDHDHDDVYARSADVYTKADVYGRSEVYNKSEVYAKTEVYNKDEVYNNSEVYSKAEVDAMVSPGTKYVSVSSMALVRVSVDADIALHVGFGEGYMRSGTRTWGLIPVFLPQGATVTRFTCRIMDTTDTGRVQVELARQSMTAPYVSNLAKANTTNGLTFPGNGWGTVEDDSIEVAVVDNSVAAYYVVVLFEGTEANTGRFGMCTIEYTE
jgi:hypothetical protein